MSNSKLKKVGIFAGSFDPVHIGHVEFALQAAHKAGLNEVFFMPERQPRRKESVTSLEHRVAMLGLGLKKHEELEVLDLMEPQFTIAGTLPKLNAHFPEAELYFLIGSDVASTLPKWNGVQELVDNARFIVGLRSGGERENLHELMAGLKAQVIFVDSPHPEVSATQIRQDPLKDISQGVKAYIDEHGLYKSRPKQPLII